MKLKIVTVPDPILQKKSKPIKKIDKNIKKLAQEMIDLIKEGPDDEPIGVGLSAVQVGKLKRLFVAYNPNNKTYQVFINPQIIEKSKKLTSGLPESENKYEGCLSIPGIFGIVKRHQWIKMRYQTLNGKQESKKFSGFFATVIQHEYDHNNGILFTQRVLEQKGKLYQLQETPDRDKLIEIELK